MDVQQLAILAAVGGGAGGLVAGLVLWLLIARIALGTARDVGQMRDAVLEMCQTENDALRRRIRQLEGPNNAA